MNKKNISIFVFVILFAISIFYFNKIDYKDKKNISNKEFITDLRKFNKNEETSKYFKDINNIILVYKDKKNVDILKNINNEKYKFLVNKVRILKEN